MLVNMSPFNLEMSPLQTSFIHTEMFIREIEKHSCIWDPFTQEYTNKTKRTDAWKEVCQVIYPDFDHKTSFEQTEIVESSPDDVSFQSSNNLNEDKYQWTKFRHSRHLKSVNQHGGPHSEAYMDDLNSFQYNGMPSSNINGIPGSVPNTGSFKLTVQDNHKPVFVNCSKYHPSVKEEEPTGTFVFQVHAVDKDPPDSGGTITYSFVYSHGERLKFAIDPHTGVVTTKHMFDRDELLREKESYLTVRATDNGRPQLDDACTIKVTIEDINDNTPTFDKVNYIESVPQDLPLGEEVMRISATDIDDGNNSIVVYDISSRIISEQKYFRIDHNTGIIYLNKNIDKDPGYKFKMKATATDQGVQPNSAFIDLEILVIESHKKAPSFTSIPHSPIILLENFTDFSYNIATLTAVSNTDEKNPVFELVTGRKAQANKNTFRLDSEGNMAFIRLAQSLDYESVTEYTLTIRIQNKYNLAAETSIGIQVEDVNDNIPLFVDVVSGSVLENEPRGTQVMQVKAIDLDATSANNQVTYELGDNEEYFTIDMYTGNITTLVTFDREERDAYNVKVIATDNAPSSRYTTGVHNKGQQVFRIEIADKNDHPPRFTQIVYYADAIPENANINSIVTEVKALDNDTASTITYSIIDGNIFNAFFIESATGKIRVNSQLDYENITSYTLKVRAFDGVFEDYCKVEIKLENVNDNPPKFSPYNANVTIPEEKLVEGCIAQLQAYDPDIADRNAPQHIQYYVVKEDQQKLLTIDKNGCLSLIKPLDRDPPNGYEIWQVWIGANDEDGQSQHSSQSSTEVVITLIDINDNAPYLNLPQPVVWRENQGPGVIVHLTAQDDDGPENGAPFAFYIPPDAPYDIQTKFRINRFDLEAAERFDREEKKEYLIPIAITDSGLPAMTGTSTLRVIIGDENDNPMKPGTSNIFVYNYKGESPDSEIGRVYVDDPDDWDLADKYFQWHQGYQHPNFDLNSLTGMITMKQGTAADTYMLSFNVSEEAPKVRRHTVNAIVNVTVKEIPEEAVDKSGSIRFADVTAEEFITKNQDGESKATILRAQIALALNITEENVDVFTVLHSPHQTGLTQQLDVRFSAHGSPYYEPEKINSAINLHQEEIEQSLHLDIEMINIDECLVEQLYCEGSCYNFLKKSNVPAAVYTNKTSFIGVSAIVDPFCHCKVIPQVCLNGGTYIDDKCVCPEPYDGPNCESAAIGFQGDGWALYPSLQSCEDSHLSLHLITSQDEGLVFYIGPDSVKPSSLGIQDFMSLQIKGGYAVLYVDYGSGTTRLENTHIRVSDQVMHKIDILLTKTSIELQVDDCKFHACMSIGAPVGGNKFLNVNGPLQVGGTYVDLSRISFYRNWTHKPSTIGFVGCVRNLTYNNNMYNLGRPSISKNRDIGCSTSLIIAAPFTFNWNYLWLLLILLLIATVMLLAVVAQRRKSDDMYKDTDDIRENIINYEDEGGGEGDMTGYDLNVLRLMYDGPVGEKHQNGPYISSGPNEVPDICGFLDGKKHSVDNDPETTPFDDVRHYAYEGDGNTTGSLSSLASGTDEGDLNFDYLSNFGPRFRKLADMYGEDGSDEESDTYHNAASESWC